MLGKRSEMPAHLCKADQVEVMQNNYIVLTQRWGLRDSYLKRPLDFEDRRRVPKNHIETSDIYVK